MAECPSCGRENADDGRCCSACGTQLAAFEQAREQRKVVTILFCDLVGSTALGEATDPEVLRARMSRTFESLRTIVERHGGTVEKFVGDAVMAVFEIPVSHEDDALRAVRAASEMRVLIAEHGLESRIGLNSGEVVVGGQGETLVTGNAVNLAARGACRGAAAGRRDRRPPPERRRRALARADASRGRVARRDARPQGAHSLDLADLPRGGLPLPPPPHSRRGLRVASEGRREPSSTRTSPTGSRRRISSSATRSSATTSSRHRYRSELDPTDSSLPELAEAASARLGAAGRAALDRGDVDACRTLLQRAIAILPATEERRYAVAPYLAFASWGTLRSAGMTVSAAGMSMYSAWVEQHAGDTEAWERVLRDGLVELEASDERAFAATITAYLAQCLCEQGRYDEAHELCAVVREMSPSDDVVNFIYADALEGSVLARRGRHEEALALLTRALELVDATDFFYVRADVRLNVAEALALADREDRARAIARDALEIYAAKGDVTGGARARERLARTGIQVT